jgi:hypothetical protein
MPLDPSSNQIEKLKNRLNLVLIALLCSTTLTPIVIFFVTGPGSFAWLFIAGSISFFVALLPKTFYDRIQLSGNLKVYKKLQVHRFKKYATNGDLINRKIRVKYPRYRIISDAASIRKKLDETYVVEKSHTVLFVFCLLVTIHAFLLSAIGTAILLAVGNLVFNLYPNFLQQYNRIRYQQALLKART